MIKKSLTKACLILACLVPAIAFAQPSALPDIGSSSGRTLSPSEERILGEMIMQEIYRHLPLINDPFAQSYVQHLGDELAHAIPGQHQTYTFFIVNASTINAFALPGGFIGVHTGLIMQSRNESELAGVISHEIAHVNQRHLARMFEKSKQMSMPTMAAMLGAMIISAANPALGSSLLAGTMAGAQQMAINFTRHNEEEADRVGIDMLAKAGFDPNGMSHFFDRMGQANRYNGGESIPEFLRTHPMSTNRMADAQNRAQNYPIPAQRDEREYRLIKERVRNFTSKPNSLDHYYKNQPLNDDAATYGYALALTHEKKYTAAADLFKQLLKKEPDNVLYQMGKADLLAAQKDYTNAEKITLNLYKDYPYNLALLVELSDFYISAQQPQKARDVLKDSLKRRAGLAVLYSLLARAYVDLREEKNALITQADFFAARWNYEAAIRQLEMAKKTPPINDYETAILEAKKKKYEAALAQQEKLKKELG
jgi:beta-barrel assembly-enhancing protease